MKITKYIIVSGISVEVLTGSVNRSIEKDFTPYGSPYYDGKLHHQAMVKYEESSEKQVL